MSTFTKQYRQYLQQGKRKRVLQKLQFVERFVEDVCGLLLDKKSGTLIYNCVSGKFFAYRILIYYTPLPILTIYNQQNGKQTRLDYSNPGLSDILEQYAKQQQIIYRSLSGFVEAVRYD